MAHVEDRWSAVTRNPDGSTTRRRTPRDGTGKRWRARYADPAGAERSRSFHRKGDAERFLARIGADLERGAYVTPGAGRQDLASYAQGWLAGLTGAVTTRERAAQRLRVHILPGLGSRSLAELAQRPSLIQAWLAGLPVAPSSAQVTLATLSAILGTAADDGLISRNPCSARSVKAPRIPDRKVVPWTAGQVAAVRAALPARYQALADAGAGLGLRQGEAFGLSPDDAGWLRGDIHVRRQVRIAGWKLCFAPPKGGRERHVPLPAVVRERLAAHLAAFPAVPVTLPWLEPGGPLVTVPLMFTTSARKAIDRAYFHRLWRDGRAAAGVAPGRENGFHALRHHYASALLHGGADIRAVSEYLGHHDPAFTLRVYTHLMPGGRDRARQIIDEALRDAPDGPEADRAVPG